MYASYSFIKKELIEFFNSASQQSINDFEIYRLDDTTLIISRSNLRKVIKLIETVKNLRNPTESDYAVLINLTHELSVGIIYIAKIIYAPPAKWLKFTIDNPSIDRYQKLPVDFQYFNNVEEYNVAKEAVVMAEDAAAKVKKAVMKENVQMEIISSRVTWIDEIGHGHIKIDSAEYIIKPHALINFISRYKTLTPESQALNNSSAVAKLRKYLMTANLVDRRNNVEQFLKYKELVRYFMTKSGWVFVMNEYENIIITIYNRPSYSNTFRIQK